jgi:pyruvate dehydrogenase E1 component
MDATSDAIETQEWLDALATVKVDRAVDRSNFTVSSVVEAAQRDRIYAPQSLKTPHSNSIVERQPSLTGHRAIEVLRRLVASIKPMNTPRRRRGPMHHSAQQMTSSVMVCVWANRQERGF